MQSHLTEITFIIFIFSQVKNKLNFGVYVMFTLVYFTFAVIWLSHESGSLFLFKSSDEIVKTYGELYILPHIVTIYN